MTETLVLSAARTPFGKLLGSLSHLSSVELGGFAIDGALRSAGIAPDRVDHVVMGQVLTAGVGQIPARQAASRAGIPMVTPALTVNKVCLSGTQAVVYGHFLIQTGQADIVVAGGQESMSRAPHLLSDSRRGTRFGRSEVHDHMQMDGLRDVWLDVSMGELTELGNKDEGLTRAEQDEFSLHSHHRAETATNAGVFDGEIVAVPGARDGQIVERDEGFRPNLSIEELAALKPAFTVDGTITAGNSSQISDGAAAVVLSSNRAAEKLGVSPLAVVESIGMVAGPDSRLQHQPAAAIENALQKISLTPGELDLVEINEAFAAVGISSARRLGVPMEQVNVNGGAISLGHPIGASGARLVGHLAHELHRRNAQRGAVGLCGGGGQGDAVILRRP